MRDIPSLTGLRGVAALWVMAFHVCKVAGDAHAPWAAHAGMLGFGWTGVDLFFVLSGFILMWVHGADFARPTSTALARFAAGRIVRVYPLSLVVLALIVALTLADPGFVAWYRTRDGDNFSLQALARTALLATRWVTGRGGDWNEPTWSLSAEVLGYAAFPVLAWVLIRCSPKAAMTIGVLSLVVLGAFEILTGLAGTNPIDQIPALMRMGCGFIAGMAACRVRQGDWIWKKSSRRGLSSPVQRSETGEGDRLKGGGGGFYAARSPFHHATRGPPSPLRREGEEADQAASTPMRLAAIGALGTVLAVGLACQIRLGVLLAPAGFALLIFCLSFRAGALNALLSSRPALFLGRISFPLYLVHLTPLLWLSAHVRLGALSALSAATLIAGYMAFCVASATLLHVVIERPLHRWARRGFPFRRASRALAHAA